MSTTIRAAVLIAVAGTVLLFAQTPQPASLLHADKTAASDLEIGGAAQNKSGGAHQFISYEALLTLPQTKYTSTETNFAAPSAVSGVPLKELLRAFATGDDMVVALCADGYRSNYPAEYIAAHRPVLLLTVDGKPPAQWPKTPEGDELGSYVISNPGFVPSFKVLSHSDEAQIPFQVVQLQFRREGEVFAGITPHGSLATDSPVAQGFRIAQQNCFRCHNLGNEGGKMAGVPWPVIGALAKANPAFFARYVRTPQAVNPHSKMAGSPGYDDQTIAALRAYFTTFAPGA